MYQQITLLPMNLPGLLRSMAKKKFAEISQITNLTEQFWILLES